MWTKRVLLSCAAVGALAASIVIVTGKSSDEIVILGEGSGRYPAQTATDWVSNADYVVVVAVVRDSAMPLTPSQRESGEGLVNRDVAMGVIETVWTSEGAKHELPKEIHYVSTGWALKNGDLTESPKLAEDDTPRFEVGHTYVMALEYDECAESETYRWRGLSSDSNIPFDDEILGNGELAGKIVEPSDHEVPRDDLEYGLKDAVNGEPLETLSRTLANTKPLPEEEQFVPATTCR